jgi:hypothetical protein
MVKERGGGRDRSEGRKEVCLSVCVCAREVGGGRCKVRARDKERVCMCEMHVDVSIHKNDIPFAPAASIQSLYQRGDFEPSRCRISLFVFTHTYLSACEKSFRSRR